MRLSRTAPIAPTDVDAGTTPVLPSKKGVVAGAKSCVTVTSSCSSDATTDQEDEYVMTQDVAEILVSRTEKKVRAFLEKSQWVRNNSRLSQIPRLNASDFVLGKILAEGGFAYIHEINGYQVVPNADDEEEKEAQQEAPAAVVSSNNKKETRYVVKHLKPDLALAPQKLRSAAKDICNEIHVLSALDHKHIIQVKGLSSAGISCFAETCRADSFFLVLERMDETLLDRISRWRKEGITKRALDLKQLGKCPLTTQLFQDRIRVAQQLASALNYLHQNRIMHRDLKPGNVCFDADGCLKLIDFGLAVELPADSNPDATFDLGNAGTVRYQSPEIIARKPYNCKAETYSMSIVLWEMMALIKPFENLDGDEVKQSVVEIGYRPRVRGSWPGALKKLLKKGWSKRISQRPTMAEMESALEKIADQAPLYHTKKGMMTSWFS